MSMEPKLWSRRVWLDLSNMQPHEIDLSTSESLERSSCAYQGELYLLVMLGLWILFVPGSRVHKCALYLRPVTRRSYENAGFYTFLITGPFEWQCVSMKPRPPTVTSLKPSDTVSVLYTHLYFSARWEKFSFSFVFIICFLDPIAQIFQLSLMWNGFKFCSLQIRFPIVIISSKKRMFRTDYSTSGVFWQGGEEGRN